MTTAAEAEGKKLALRLVLRAWDEAQAAGTSPDIIASATLYAVICELVDRHGQEAAADFFASLPARIRAGEMTLATNPQAE